MPLYIASLNSGSNANCYYIGDSQNGVLVDAGLSCRETEKRMKRLELSMDKVKALFVSHEHTDHITGVHGIAKKYQLPVYITETTLKRSNMHIEQHLIRSFKHAIPEKIGELSVTAFRKSHDAGDPHSFLISAYGINIGVITDIGFACQEVIKHFGKCHAAFLESNYCDEMLSNGSYPYHLKRRISGEQGHLSNAQALDLFRQHKGNNLGLLILSHLSKNNNKPELVESLFKQHAGNTQIVVASRYEPTVLFCVENNLQPERPVAIKQQSRKNERQLSLF
jgi:phosphoribosyl 1,2-cyclic phosphodiesterase